MVLEHIFTRFAPFHCQRLLGLKIRRLRQSLSTFTGFIHLTQQTLPWLPPSFPQNRHHMQLPYGLQGVTCLASVNDGYRAGFLTQMYIIIT